MRVFILTARGRSLARFECLYFNMHYLAGLVASLNNNDMGAEAGMMIPDALKQPTCKVHTIRSVHA